MKNILLIQSELSSLEMVYQRVNNFLINKVQKKTLQNILLITQEMVTNSILHGNNNEKSKKVSIKITVDTSHVTVDIEDEGEGLEKLPSKEEAQNLNYLEENGRGLKLTVLMTENIELDGNKIKLIFKNNKNNEG